MYWKTKNEYQYSYYMSHLIDKTGNHQISTAHYFFFNYQNDSPRFCDSLSSDNFNIYQLFTISVLGTYILLIKAENLQAKWSAQNLNFNKCRWDQNESRQARLPDAKLALCLPCNSLDFARLQKQLQE